MSIANKEIVEAYVKAFNSGDLAKLRTLFTKDAVIHGVLGWGPIEEIIPIWKELHDAFHVVLEIVSIVAEGDIVAVRYKEHGTFTKPFRGKEPTGKSFELVAMEWFEFKNGKIHRRWGARDHASQMRQLEI